MCLVTSNGAVVAAPDNGPAQPGRSGSDYLDHALANPEMADAMAQVQTWRTNADEPRFLGYDGPDNAQRYRQPDPFRSSDHDPVAVDLRWP